MWVQRDKRRGPHGQHCDFLNKVVHSSVQKTVSIHRNAMQSKELQTYPKNMRLLLNPTSQDLSKMNIEVWFCIMTEFSDMDKFQ